MIKYNFLKSCSEIDKKKFERQNWYLMNWGMGDAIDATLFLESQSPVTYKILCRPGVFNGIKFVLDNFIKNPKCKEIQVFPLEIGYPIPEDEIIMSKNGFYPQDLTILNNAHNIGHLKVCHMAPKLWSVLQNLHGSGIISNIEKYSNVKKDIQEKTCILFPERGDSYQLDDSFWNSIVLKMKERGYRVIVNWTSKSEVFTNQKIFEGTEKLNKLELQDLIDYLIRHENLVTIGQISGIFVLLKYFEFLKIAFFVDYHDPKMKDPTRALYESCSLADGLYTKNMLELKLSKFNINQLDLVVL
jgi:hypothetical protein